MIGEVKDTDFMNELEAATRLKPSASAIAVLFAIGTLVIFFILWAAVTQIEEMVTGQGQIVPTSEIQTVQSLEGGILQELLVSEGDIVEKGQILLRISDVQFSSEERGTEAKFLGLSAKKARLTAESNGQEFKIPDEILKKAPQVAANEKALYDSRQKELTSAYAILDERINKASADLAGVKSDINSFSENRNLLQKELSITRDMVAQRAVPKLDQIRLERELADISGQLNAKVQEKTGLEADLAAAKNERESQEDKFRSQALTELNEVETEIAALQENLKSIGDRVYRTELRSPVNGIVNAIKIKTIGGVVEPAMRLMEIVPVDDELKIMAKVSPSDIAFMHPGQPVKVKITAYESQKYGTLDGTLIRIGANTVTDRDGKTFFEIEVRTVKNYMGDEGKKLPITPGMVAETRVITGKRTIMNYLLKPLHRGLERALRER